MTDVAPAKTKNATARHLARASIINSLLLPIAAALQLSVSFWALVVTNFVLMHAVWLIQVVRRRNWGEVDFGLMIWPLIAFAVFGNIALLRWGERLLAVFPA